MKIRNKLVIMTSIIVIIAMLIISFSICGLAKTDMEKMLFSYIDEGGKEYLNTFINNYHEGDSVDFFGIECENLKNMLKDIDSCFVLGTDGTVLFSDGFDTSMEFHIKQDSDWHFNENKQLRKLVFDLKTDDEIVGQLNLVSAGESIATELKEMMRRVVYLFILVFGLSLVTVFFFTGKFMEPINELHHVTSELKKGRLNVKTKIKTKDEFAELGDILNKTINALAAFEDQREELDRAKTEFLSITSHELRSPMTPMKAQLQMLLQGYMGKISKKQEDAVRLVLRNTARLDKIIMDFLEISRIEAARLKFNFIKTDLKKYIENLVKEMREIMPEKKIKISLDIGKLPKIEVDPDRVLQILRNLLENAKKFSQPNKVVDVSVKAQGSYIKFKIRDRGIGLAPEDQARVFEPFFQAEKTMYRKYGGTGLGLAICKGIVESQNGKLWIDSKIGKGTTFHFTVPMVPVRKIKPIKLLFSEQKNIENKVRNIFIEHLGPLGKNEFKTLSERGLKYIAIISYLEKIRINGIIDEKGFLSMKSEVMKIFGMQNDFSEEEGQRLKAALIYKNFLGDEGVDHFKELKDKTIDGILRDIVQQTNSLTPEKIENMKAEVKKIFK